MKIDLASQFNNQSIKIMTVTSVVYFADLVKTSFKFMSRLGRAARCTSDLTSAQDQPGRKSSYILRRPQNFVKSPL